MLEKDEQHTDVPTYAGITAAQQGLLQLLAKAVAERLANSKGTSATDETASRK